MVRDLRGPWTLQKGGSVVARELDGDKCPKEGSTWSSGDQVIVLCCKKESTDKMNKKQESTEFIEAKAHT